MKRIFALVFGICLMGGAVKSQTLDSKYGLDSAQTIMNASIYAEFVKQKNYKDALPAWRYLFNNAPKYQMSVYTRGVSIIGYMLRSTKNPAYVDTLMMVYDQRIKYYGNHPKVGESYILGRKGLDLVRMGKQDTETKKQAYAHMSKSFELRGAAMEPLIVPIMFITAGDLLNAEVLTKDEYINFYMRVSDYVDNGIKKAAKPEVFKELKPKIDALFFDSGVADCQTLDQLLTIKFDMNPEDLDNLKSISSLLRRNECLDLPLYSTVAEKLYQLDPAADAAYSLAIMFLRNQDYDKAEGYLQEAIDKSDDVTDVEVKAEYYIRLAQLKLAKKEFSAVKANALAVLKLNPKDGEAYMLIGKAYAYHAPFYGEDAFEHASVYWAAVDKFNRAKQVDPSVADEANKQIHTYSEHFPSKDEAFFRSITAGSSIKLGSWINETVKARFAK